MYCTLKQSAAFLGTIVLLYVLCFTSVQAHVSEHEDEHQTRRRRILSPEGSKVEGKWVAKINRKSCEAAKESINELKRQHSNTLQQRYSNLDTKIAKVTKKCFAEFTGDEAFANLVKESIDDVEYVEPELEITSLGPASWGLDRVDQADLPLDNDDYQPSYTGTGVDVYVLDTGILKTHEEFGSRAEYGPDYINEDRKADMNGHGTHCAGTIGGKTYGVARKASLIGVKVLSGEGYGSTFGIVEALGEVVQLASGKASVISMSLGGGKSNAMNDAVNEASDAGMIVVVAAGNSNDDACFYSPASAGGSGMNGGVISVGSTTKSDQRSSFSNYGKCTDVFAPGSSITSAWHTGNKASNTISGTSMACPHVAGAAALLLEKHSHDKDAAIDELFNLVAKNKLSSMPSKTPNKLLQVPMYTGPPTPPTPEPTNEPTSPTVTPPTSSPTMSEPQLCTKDFDICFEFLESLFGPGIPSDEVIGAPLVVADTLLCGEGDEQVNMDGKIVLVMRGDCYFADKTLLAESKGAKALIIHMADGSPIFNPAPPPGMPVEPTIPSMMISLKDGLKLKKNYQGQIIRIGRPSLTIAPTTPTTISPTSSPMLLPCEEMNNKQCKNYPERCKLVGGRRKKCQSLATVSPTAEGSTGGTPSPTGSIECTNLKKKDCINSPDCIPIIKRGRYKGCEPFIPDTNTPSFSDTLYPSVISTPAPFTESCEGLKKNKCINTPGCVPEFNKRGRYKGCVPEVANTESPTAPSVSCNYGDFKYAKNFCGGTSGLCSIEELDVYDGEIPCKEVPIWTKQACGRGKTVVFHGDDKTLECKKRSNQYNVLCCKD